MSLTTIVDDKNWTEISPIGATRLAVALDPTEVTGGCVYLIVATEVPNVNKTRPIEGDQAMAISQVFGRDSVIFANMAEGDRVFARASAGISRTILATTKI